MNAEKKIAVVTVLPVESEERLLLSLLLREHL